MNASRTSCALALIAVCLSPFALYEKAAAADPLDARALQRKEEDQQRARALTRELVSSILDIQLQQLEENGLREMQIYRDIATMRGNISGLVESEMAQVVELLAAAQSGEPAQREAKFVEARRSIREIVLRLSIERQNLLRRLKIAAIVEQASRLIRLQTRALRTTEALPALPRAERETTALKTIEDQRDVKQLFLLLVRTLDEARGWGGSLATGAHDGLRVLKAARVGTHLDEAGRALEATDFAPAAEHQAQVVEGLRKLLQVLTQTQGVLDAEREQMLGRVRELAKKQEQLREATQETPDAARPEENLIQEQAQLQKQLGELTRQLQDAPEARTHLEQSEKAAYEATAKLFEGDKEAALAEQGKVLGNLAALEEALAEAGELTESDRSAAELARRVEDLEAL
jgi:hypothetical protein